MKKSSTQVLGAACISGKKRRELAHSSTEHTLTDDPDDDLLFSSWFVSAGDTGSPARLLPSATKTSQPQQEEDDDEENWLRNKPNKKKKRQRSSISLTSFPNAVRQEQQISASEVPGVRIRVTKWTSMSALRTTPSIVRRLFARDSGNVSLSPGNQMRGEVDASSSLVTPSIGPAHKSAVTRIASLQGRRLFQMLQSAAAVPLQDRRQSLSSVGNEDHEEGSSGERRGTDQSHSSSSLSTSPRKLSYSSDDIDRLIQITPHSKRKIQKNKKRSRVVSREQRTSEGRVSGDQSRDGDVDVIQDPSDGIDDEREERRGSYDHEASFSAGANKLPEEQKRHPSDSMAAERKKEDTMLLQHAMKKCNSNFEMGSFCRSKELRMRIRRSTLFAGDSFPGFREEDEQPDIGMAAVGMMPAAMQPHYGQQEAVLYQKGNREDQCQGTLDSVLTLPADKSSSSPSAPHPYDISICTKSLPSPVSQVAPCVASRQRFTSTTSGATDPISVGTKSSCTKVLLCRLCLEELAETEFRRIVSCGCTFCHSCLSLYLTIRIQENLNVGSLSCPDAGCPVAAAAISHLITSASSSVSSGSSSNVISKRKNIKFSLLRHPFSLLRRSKSAVLKQESKTGKSVPSVERVPNPISHNEIQTLVDDKTFALYNKLILEMEVERDPSRTFCPTANCDNICLIMKQSQVLTSAAISVSSTISSLSAVSPTAATSVLLNAKRFKSSSAKSSASAAAVSAVIYCCKCDKRFCVSCRQEYHPDRACGSEDQETDELMHLMSGEEETAGGEIKRCPRCSVWIERDEGCAQMMCRKCRHVFCWFCLKSLEDDFLLRHYDTGPCKNKLGHSRASVVWHRTQVVGIFAGFGVLLLLVSPLFLIAAPCLLCCNCFSCCCSSCPQTATHHTDLLTPSSSFDDDDLDQKERELLRVGL